MSNEVERVDAHVYGYSEPLAALRLDGRPAGFTRIRNRCRQTESVHAAGGDCDMRIPQEPSAVVDVENHVRRYDNPLAIVDRGRFLTIPHLGVRDESRRVAERVRVNADAVLSLLFEERLHVRQRLIPV